MQQQNIISFPTKYMHTSFSHKLLISLISLIFLSVLIEAAPITPSLLTDLPILKSLANYAAATYCTVPLDNWDCGEICRVNEGTQVVKIFNNDRLHTKGFIALDHSKDLIVVAYRGTVRGNLVNLATDLKFVKGKYDPIPGTLVHIGFYEAFKQIQSQVTDEILRLHQENPGYSIGFLGHSLGGALAALSALDVIQKEPSLGNRNEKLFLKTFGQPRVGDEKFAEYVDKNINTLRTVVRGDPVPHLPLLTKIPVVGNFKHFGEELYINNPIEDPNAFIKCGVEDPNCSISAPISALNIDFHSGPYYEVNMRDCERNADGSGSSGDNVGDNGGENVGDNVGDNGGENVGDNVGDNGGDKGDDKGDDDDDDDDDSDDDSDDDDDDDDDDD